MNSEKIHLGTLINVLMPVHTIEHLLKFTNESANLSNHEAGDIGPLTA